MRLVFSSEKSLADEHRKGLALMAGVADAHGQAKEMAIRSPDVERLASKLEGLLRRFDRDSAGQELAENDSLRVKLAQSALARREGRNFQRCSCCCRIPLPRMWTPS